MSEWSWRKKACLVVVLFLLLSFPIAEIYLKLKGKQIYCSHWKNLPNIGWRNHPGLFLSAEGRGVYELFWDNGSRASRYPRGKNSMHRIAVVGCSYTEGVGVRDEETLVWKLNDRFPHTVFDNYGTSGYSTRQCYLLIEELLQKKEYELIIYCAIADHLNRFLKPTPCWVTNFSDDQLTVMPWTECGETENIYHPATTIELPGSRRFLSMELLNRILINAWCKMTRDIPLDERQTIFHRTLAEMNSLCTQNNTKFAVVYLSGRNRLRLPQKNIVAYEAYYPRVLGEDQYVDPSAPPPPPQGRMDGDLPSHYRNGNDPYGHPNHVVHNYWALVIGRWLRQQGLVTE